MDRPDLLRVAGDRLSRLERAQIRFVRETFEPGRRQGVIRWCQQHIGSTWIHHFTKHLRHVHGLERLPALDPAQSFILVSNHRSFFDLYVITGDLVRRGCRTGSCSRCARPSSTTRPRACWSTA